jgi:hypothetical protein
MTGILSGRVAASPPVEDAATLDTGLLVLLHHIDGHRPEVAATLTDALYGNAVAKARVLLDPSFPLDRDRMNGAAHLALRDAIVCATATLGLS